MKKGIRKDLFPGALELMVLQTLRRQPLHGYALAQVIKESSRDLLQVEEGSLYPALQRILKEGWVRARWMTSTSGRRIRVYEITSSGSQYLEAERKRIGRMFDGVRLVLDLVKG